jgi:predicted 3-demethylubiquinone-9 3-methyltransferase (glyoxalase superfamily)
MQKFTTFLMFQERQANAALDFYCSTFADSQIVNLTRSADGSVMHATFTLGGQQFMAIDSSVVHDFTFTPAISVYVSCASEEEVDRYFAALSDGGKVLMPLNTYLFSKKYAWVTDKFGVSWQIGLVG